MITDEEILQRHDQGCRVRAAIELKIVNRLISDAKAAGYALSITQYYGEVVPDIKAALFNLDEAHLVFHKGKKRVGWVYLVFGNSGWDLISDYTVDLEDFLKGAQSVADECEKIS